MVAGPAEHAPPVTDTILTRQLAAWGDPSGEHPYDPGVLLLGLATWTRLHGITSLEIEGVFTQMGIDASRLYTSEINHLIAQRSAGGLRGDVFAASGNV